MKIFNRLYIIAGLILLSPPSLFAQYEKGEINHLIVSIDTKPAHSYPKNISDELIRFINKHQVLKKNDFISVLQYSVAENDPKLDKYVRIPSDSDQKKHVFDRISDENCLNRIFSHSNWWKYSQSTYHVAGYSLSSIAKPYSIAAIKTDSLLVNRTYIALVTDHRYNAQDFYQELEAWRTNTRSQLSFNDIMGKCYEVDQEYFMNYIDTKVINYSCYIDLYEYIPLSKDVSANSVFYYPPTLKAVRVKGEGYRITLPLKNTVPEKFKTKQIEIVSRYDNGERSEPSIRTNKDEFEYVVAADKRGKITQLEISAWLNLIDGFYNATLLTPDDNCSPGLNLNIKVEYPEDARVFGIPLIDAFWLFEPEDQYKAAFILNVIIGAALILLLALCLKMLGHYVPNNDQIHLE